MKGIRSRKEQPMRTVQQIIDTRGGLEALKRTSIRLEVPGFMRLVIEHVGTGLRAPRSLIGISHPESGVSTAFVEEASMTREKVAHGVKLQFSDLSLPIPQIAWKSWIPPNATVLTGRPDLPTAVDTLQ
jgi:hypothetical protein